MGMGTVRSVRAAALVAIALTLAACAGPDPAGPSSAPPTASPAASPTPSESPTPSPAPTADPLSAVESVVVLPMRLELRSNGDVVAALDYMSSPTAAIAALTRALGSGPSSEPYEGNDHFPAGVVHTWDGLSINERFYDEERRQAEGLDWVVWPRFSVIVEGTAAGGATVSTAQGYQAGDEWAAVSADGDFDPDIRTCEGTPIAVEEIETPQGPKRVAVTVYATEDGAAVEAIRAPAVEMDACV